MINKSNKVKYKMCLQFDETFMKEKNHSLDRVTIFLDTIPLAYFSEVKLCLNGLVLFYHCLNFLQYCLKK